MPVPLTNRPLSYVDNIPALLFTPLEVEQLNKQRENTLIMKFSAGRPSLQDIRSHIAAEWQLASPPAVGLLDPRHVTIHMGSFADTTRALSRNSNRIQNSLFRLFRWSPDFKIGKDSSMAAVWVKLHNLPLQYYNETSLHRIGSVIGTVLRICPRTLDFTQQMYARVCIELDVSKPLLEKIFIGITKEHGWYQEIEYEGNHAYCSYCGLLGHMAGLCRKKRQDNGKTIVTENKDTKAPVSILKRGEPQANKEKTILRDAGLISESSKAGSTKDEEHHTKATPGIVTPEQAVKGTTDQQTKKVTDQPDMDNAQGSTTAGNIAEAPKTSPPYQPDGDIVNSATKGQANQLPTAAEVDIGERTLADKETSGGTHGLIQKSVGFDLTHNAQVLAEENPIRVDGNIDAEPTSEMPKDTKQDEAITTFNKISLRPLKTKKITWKSILILRLKRKSAMGHLQNLMAKYKAVKRWEK